MDELYNRILQMGIERGYKNMTAVCSAADVKRATMTEYKKGRTTKLSIDTLLKFSTLYGVSVEQLLSGEQKEKSPAQTDEGLDAKKALLMQLWDALDASGRSALLADATALANNRKQKDIQ